MGCWEYIINEENNNKADPTAWIKKYFTVASISIFAEVEDINGINDNIFNSKPVHSIIQLLEFKVSIILMMSEDINKIL